ncbi:hypothetical protein QLS71_011525 [Mariniflexile litorale]|uniref:Uncharacterized protein n=1 Tax=Mariniflexile litorale TaxID=3045158 RepID=A0AAU7EC24_9FLAO|nr:hypothetical protein [Mariniflexile sp. KMM 9835]MDQ8212980.1 hypothetical protein [Mariniflexile sp. KMM 9835]
MSIVISDLGYQNHFFRDRVPQGYSLSGGHYTPSSTVSFPTSFLQSMIYFYGIEL